MTLRASLPLLTAALLSSCAHDTPRLAPAQLPVAPAPAPAPPPPPDPLALAEGLSAELHTALRALGELIWQRWTQGSGPQPSTALEAHPRLWAPAGLDILQEAIAHSADPLQRNALTLVRLEILPQAVAAQTIAATQPLEEARARLTFAAPGDTRPEHGVRDLDRLLTDESSAQRRAEIAAAEAQVVTALLPLQLERERAEGEARLRLGVGDWPALIGQLHGRSLSSLVQLASDTLSATDDLADRAVAESAQRSLGLPPDRLHRGDLPRLVRTALADPEFKGDRGWLLTRDLFANLGLALEVHIDAQNSPAKAARPLALLVDPPADVRLSLRSTGGLDELRALLHEAARASTALRSDNPSFNGRWEPLRLGDGTASLAIAALFEGLTTDPAFLRETTTLRGEPLDDVVHTEATRRLLSLRRACALVLFEATRRDGAATGGDGPSAPAPLSPDQTSELFARLLERATRVHHSILDGARWPLEADPWLTSALILRASLAAGSIEASLQAPAAASPSPSPWWSAPSSRPLLLAVAALGQAGTAEQATAVLHTELNPAPLIQVLTARLAYQAPEHPPAAPKPDYAQLQGDKRPRKKAKKAKQPKRR